MTTKKYDLSVRETITEMKQQYEKMVRDVDRNQLSTMTPDDAYELGYRAAIFDLEHLTGPDPKITYNDAAGRLERGELND